MLTTEKYKGVKEFYVCTNIAYLTLILLFSTIDMRRHLQAAFYFNHTKLSDQRGLNLLKLRTVEIVGTNIDLT